MSWTCSRVAALGAAQVEVVAPRPGGSGEVAILSSRLEGNIWDATVSLFDARVAPWHLTAQLPLHDTASVLAWTADPAGTLLVGSDSGDILVLRSAGVSSKDSTPRLFASLQFHDSAATCIAVSPVDASAAVSGSADGRLAVWDLSSTATPPPASGQGLRSQPAAVLAGWHAGGVTCAAFAPPLSNPPADSSDGSLPPASPPVILATGGGSGGGPGAASSSSVVVLWNLRAPAAPLAVLPATSSVTALAWIEVPAPLSSTDADEGMVPLGESLGAAQLQGGPALLLLLAVGCSDGSVRIFDPRSSVPGARVLSSPVRLGAAPLAVLPLRLRGPVRCIAATNATRTTTTMGSGVVVAWSGDDSRAACCCLSRGPVAAAAAAAAATEAVEAVAVSDAAWLGEPEEAEGGEVASFDGTGAATGSRELYPPLPQAPPAPLSAPLSPPGAASAAFPAPAPVRVSWASKAGGGGRGGAAAPPPPLPPAAPAPHLSSAWPADYIPSLAWWQQAAGLPAPLLVMASWDGSVVGCRGCAATAATGLA